MEGEKKLVGAVTGVGGIFFGETSPSAADVSTKSALAAGTLYKDSVFLASPLSLEPIELD